MKVGFAAPARPTFDVDLAAGFAASAWERLTSMGHELVGSPELVLEDEAVGIAAARLGGVSLDALVLVQATFADASLASRLADASPAPLLLWAAPEARTGERLRLNGFCGINLAGYRLTRAGRRYRWLYHDPADDGVVDLLAEVLGTAAPSLPAVTLPPDVDALPRAARDAAAEVVTRLAGTTVGIVGEHPDGFDPCAYDAADLAGTAGVRADPVALPELFARAESADGDELDAVHRRVSGSLAGVEELDPASLDRSLRLHVGLRGLTGDRGWSAVATRCWPECFTEFGGACCSPHALMNDDGIPGCCEADAYGAVTSLILQWLGGGPAFVADLVNLDLVGDTGVLWHCGLAPLAMAAPDAIPRATVHSNRRKPLLNEFPLRPGRVTIGRLSQSRGVTRLTIGGGEMLAEPRPFWGTGGVIRFDRPAAAVMDTIMLEGHEHHYGVVYGDVRPQLHALAAELRLPVIEF